MIDLGALKISVNVDTKNAADQLNDLGNKTEGTKNKLGNIINAAKNAAVIAGVGVAAKKAVEGIISLATKTADATDRIDKMSQKIGISKQGFQEWDYVCSQSGVDVGVLQNGVKTLVSQMDAAKDGAGKSVSAFTQLGLTWQDGTGQLKDQETMMNEAITALASMEDGTERAKLSTQLFGKAGVELAPILNSGVEGIDALKNNCHDLGLVMSDETINAGVKLGDTMADVKSAFGAIANKIGAQLMPIIQQVLDWIIANMPTIQRIAGEVFDKIQVCIDIIKPLIMSLLGVIQDVVKQAQTEGTAFNIIWTTIQDVFKTVIDAITGIFQAFSLAFKGDWSGFWEKILGVLDSLNGLFYRTGKKIFQSLWDGLKDIWNKIKSWFSEKIEWIESKLSFVTGKQPTNTKTAQGHRIGLSEVPYDGYTTVLHKGEMVLTAAEANQYQSSNIQLLNTLNALRTMPMANNQPICLQIDIGGDRFAEKTISLTDTYKNKIGNSKVVTV